MFTTKTLSIPKRYFSSNIWSSTSLSVLLNHGFTEKQAEHIINNLDPFLNSNSPDIIHRTLNFWKKNIFPQKGDYTKNLSTFNDVFYLKESRLLLVDKDYIEKRINSINTLDLMRGRSDFWRVFHKAPVGYFFQDWNDFLKKYYYFTFKILPLFGKKNADIHPLVEYPLIMEQSYNIIKTRFIFVQRTGFLGNESDINLSSLILSSMEEFISTYAPNCSKDEYKGLEKLCSSELGKEDDELFDNLIELAPKNPLKNEKLFLKNAIDQGILLNLK